MSRAYCKGDRRLCQVYGWRDSRAARGVTAERSLAVVRVFSADSADTRGYKPTDERADEERIRDFVVERVSVSSEVGPRGPSRPLAST
jgi:hypothetical protein